MHRFKRTFRFSYFILIVFLISLSDLIFLSHARLFSDLLFNFVLCLCLFLLPVYLFRNYMRWYYWLLFPFVLLSSIAVGCFVFFNVRLIPDVLLLAVNSNMQEATELGKGYLLGYLALMMLMMLLYIFLAAGLPAKLSAKKSRYISLISAGIFLLLPFVHWSEESYFTRMKSSLYTTFPVSFLYSVGKVYTYYRDMRNNEQARNDFRFQAKQENPPHAKQIYVLIIGESSRAGQWAINGYSRNTSPRLSKRGNLISFPDATAGAYITEYAVPILISEATPGNFELQDKEKSIVGAFKEAGFSTYWMSNQIDEGHILVHAREAGETTISMEINRLDMDIVNKTLIPALDKNEDKAFIVIHTWGNHWAYFERYPPSFDVFKPSAKYLNIKPTDLTKKELIVNSYDNSILYADAVIDSVISLIKQKEACSTVLFISDHGEDLLDDARERFMHDDPKPSKYVAHVPFFIWYSDKYKELFPDKVKCLYENKNRKISAVDVFPTLADLGSLRFPSLDTTRSLASPSFQDSRQKILGANSIVYSYDSLLKE